MGSDIAEAVRLIQQERNLTEELVLKTIEETLIAAYKRRFDTDDNAVVRFSDDNHIVYLYAKREIISDEQYDTRGDPVLEIALSEAQSFNADAEVGDEILIEVDPTAFDRIAVQTAKQKTRQDIREIQKDTLYSEYKDKVGEIVIGYHQRERGGAIFVDLRKTEGILPKRYQSPRESYVTGDRIKALIWEVNRTPAGLSIVLSRTHAEFVKRIFELEVPEIYDGIVQIYKIVREPGYRTKLAVYSNRDDVDPVGACVGLKGQRIQNVVRELEGEKIDVLRYDADPSIFIKNALSPAKVDRVYIVDPEKKVALAVLEEDQLSLAIGKQGLNVRLANRLVDWNIDVKTEEQFTEMNWQPSASRAAGALFEREESAADTQIDSLPNISGRLVGLLKENGVELIETLAGMNRFGLESLNGITQEDIAFLEAALGVNDANENDAEEESYECPECGSDVTPNMTKCPNCGVELSFEEE